MNANSQKVKEIKAKDAFEIVNNRDLVNTTIIDGRSAEMYADKHIKGAINIDAFQDSLTTELKNYLKEKKIIVYCTNYRRSELIIKKLKELHYNGKIIFISDGINGWISAGFKTIST
jgi:rhodanese-related sulfurtransferase